MKRKRIALLVAQADEEYQSDFIQGLLKRAYDENFDVYIFSMYIKYQNSKVREVGDSNIYNLVNYLMFDGVIVLSDMIQAPGVEVRIQERLRSSFTGPVICIDAESKYFHTFWTDGYQAVYDTISHMIEEHGMKDIAYVTGRRMHVHAIRRLEAYQAAMEDHGLPVREDRVFFGDFWYFSGTHAAESLLRDREHLPDAVVCANDPMAIGVAIGMEEAGIRIPEDIAIAGYGSSLEGRTSPSPITSPWLPGGYYGEYAMDSLVALMKGEEPGEAKPETSFFVGESCGCKMPAAEEARVRRKEWATGNSEGGYQSLHDYLNEDLLYAETLEDFFHTVYDYIYFLKGVRRMDIYLDEQWLETEHLVKNRFLSSGYPEHMYHALSYDMDHPGSSVEKTGRMMDTERMMEDTDAEYPVGHFFLPLFFEEKTFGYAVLDYGEVPRSYDMIVRQWMYAVSRGLEALRRTMALKEYTRIMAADITPKFPVPGEYPDMESVGDILLTEEEKKERAEVQRILDGNLLEYHFQPIVRSTDGEIYSYEALMRSGSGVRVPPLQIIHHAGALKRLRDVEKATLLNVLRIMDERKGQLEGRKVFVNSIPGVKLAPEDESRVDELLKKHAEQVVIELTEQSELADEVLNQLKEKLRSFGVGIAVDDYGTGYSNISNLLRYMPNVVKIDRSLLTDIQNSTQKQHFVRNIIEFCHDNEILALAEGVETREELQAVIRLGADLIQGYYVARPAAEIKPSIDSTMKMEISRFHREKMDGVVDQVHTAGKTPRITMSNLIKDNKTTIIIGDPNATCRDITIAGNPNVSSNIHIEILEGYAGTVTLENVTLSNQKQRPCIRMAENASLTLQLVGENRLEGGGILVPEGSSLTVGGEGNLRIRLNGTEVYGIGNVTGRRHGDLRFYQDGEITIESTGKRMVGIGSDLGGSIEIHKGKYSLYMSGSEGVAIGAESGDSDLLIQDCDFYTDFSFREGVCLGSKFGSMRLEATRALLRFNCSGTVLCVVGTLTGEHSEVYMHDLSVHMNLRSDKTTAFGSLKGVSDIRLISAAFRYKAAGTDAYIFGGESEETDAELDNVDMRAVMEVVNGTVSKAAPERIRITHGISSIEINDETFELT